MMQTELLQKDLTKVGEAISLELGAQMIKDYHASNPNDPAGTYIGRNIIELILSQPSCVGIKFYNALNEDGRKTLVYIGVDAAGNDMVKYTFVTENGKICMEDGIVADRGGNSDTGGFSIWEWLFG